MEKKSLSPQAVAELEKANEYPSPCHFSPLTIGHYLAEPRFFFVYYANASSLGSNEAMITYYLLYWAKTI